MGPNPFLVCVLHEERNREVLTGLARRPPLRRGASARLTDSALRFRLVALALDVADALFLSRRNGTVVAARRSSP